MAIKHLGFKLAAVSLALLSMSSAYAVDSVSIEGATGNKTQVARVAAQWDWKNTAWWQSNGTHISGYWDLSLAEWHGNRYNNTDNQSQNLTDVGFTPVFRFEADDKKGTYGEAGIGVHLMSQIYNNNDRHFSTAFQFGDHLAAGYVFANGLDLQLRLQHFSNGGIKQPNGGVNFAAIRAAYHF